LVVGDFNVNGRHLTKPIMDQFRNFLKFPEGRGYQVFFDEWFNDLSEYNEMLNLLSECGSVSDLAWANFGESPVTYGEKILHPEGEAHPGDVILTGPEDLLSEQSLDYILHISNEELEETQDIDHLDATLLNVRSYDL
jgi:hypothetical protein